MIAVALFRIPPEGIAAFHAYEDAVLPLLTEHGGELRQRLVSPDGTTEVHVLRFADRAAFEAYAAAPERARHRPALDASEARVELFLDLEEHPGAQ